MPLTGILLDVSASMQSSVGSGIDEQGGSWAQSIFKVIDNLIEHDLTSENRVFGIGVGASCTKQVFDIIGILQQIENVKTPSYRRNSPATGDQINKILDILGTEMVQLAYIVGCKILLLLFKMKYLITWLCWCGSNWNPTRNFSRSLCTKFYHLPVTMQTIWSYQELVA